VEKGTGHIAAFQNFLNYKNTIVFIKWHSLQSAHGQCFVWKIHPTVHWTYLNG